MSRSDTKDTVEIIQPQQFFQNRRAEARINCAVKGVICFARSGEVHDCVIIDQSASGAKLGLSEAIDNTHGDIWLIDLENHIAKLGMAAWANPIALGLRFRYVQALKPNSPRPPKVPQAIFDLWVARTSPPEDEFFLD